MDWNERKNKMTEFDLRRSQLVSPSGVGAVVTAVNGISGVIAGLDHWYGSAVGGVVSFEDFELVGEWRLIKDLGIPRFLRPPDYRDPERYLIDEGRPNLGMQVPALRFPLWSFCEYCREMELISSTQSGLRNCKNCQKKREAKAKDAPGYLPRLTQVAFMAMCEDGHMQDFPFMEWVHRDPNFDTHAPGHTLKLTVTGGYAIDAQTVSCSCKESMKRTLGQILNSIPGKAGDVGPRDTYLSRNLSGEDGGEAYRCRGIRAWLGEDPWNSDPDFRGVGCGKPIHGGLVSATNAYFPNTVSALFIPENQTSGIAEGLIDLLNADGRIVTYLDMCKVMDASPTYNRLVQMNLHLALVQYTETQIVAAMEYLVGVTSEDESGSKEATDFRFEEQKLLSKGVQSEFLRSVPARLGDYKSPSMNKFSEISLVDRLKETRVFTGFSRVVRKIEDDSDFSNMLFKKVPPANEKWLPAYSVLGEGIYLSLDPTAIRNWSMSESVQKRYEPLRETTQYLNKFGGLEAKSLLPRFVLLHTLAHILINQLVFDCGYSAAALRERIYCFDHSEEVSGILIYTAAGDSDGTMGGLVRMGKPDRFDEAIETAVENARWCSTDPVCIEVPATNFGGRSANLAACHNCALLPETSCEQYNSFLDRASIVGTVDDNAVGFFNL
jgi:hypothetical protein